MKSNLPYNVMRHRDWETAPRMPAAVAAAVVGLPSAVALSAAATAIPYLAVYAATYVAISAVTSWAISALAPKPDFSSANSGGILVNNRGSAQPQKFVYGQIRKGGTVVYDETTGTNNKFLHRVIALAGHEVEEIGDIYIDDEIVSVDPSTGLVGVAPSTGLVGGKWENKIRINKHLGDQTSADDDLLSESEQIDSNFVGRGIAYIYVRFAYDQDVFANGLPLITAVVKGKKVYDPRTDSTAYTNNAALCLRDYLVSEYGLNDDDIDDVAFQAAANECDVDVDLAGGGTEKKYTMDGRITADSNHGETLQRMVTCCAGTLFWGMGKWKLVAGAYSAPVKTLTEGDLRGPISVQPRVNIRDNFNTVRGTFNDADEDWITVDYPQVTSSVFKAEDGGDELPLDLELPFTTSPATAQRLAKLTLHRAREQIRVDADFSLDAFDVQVGDIISFSFERYGWTQKEFEVVGWKMSTGENGAPRVRLSLQETSEEAFDWNAEETAIIANNSSLLSPFEVPTPGLEVSAELRKVNQQVVGALLIDAKSNSPLLNRFEVQFKRSDQDEFTSAGQAIGGRFVATGISDGFFDVRARIVNGFGVRGPFRTINNFYATLFEAPPQDVTNFSANVVGNTLHLSWTPVPDLDLSHYKLRYSPLTSGAQYQKSVDLVSKISRPANTATVPAQTGTYFIKAIDKLGNLSEAPASIVIDTNVADIENLNVVEDQLEHPDFAGAKVDVVAATDEISSYITLDTSLLFDDALGNFDGRIGLFDFGGEDGFIAASGIYTFDGYIDLGNRFVSRVTTNLLLDFFDYINTFDSAPGSFDAREGDFDGDPSQFDTTSVRVQISTTNDDPSGTPVWSEYRDFIVGDVSARALRFRAILSSVSSGNAPAVRELSVEVDMPDRLEAADDITYTGSQVVTFPAAFKVIPAIGISAALADGDRYVISEKSRTGFTITTFTGSSVSSNPTTFDYVAKGYGKELSA